MYQLEVRRLIEVNTDPQRRCYYGAHAKSELVWAEWTELFTSANRASLEETMGVFQRANPARKYRIVEVE